VISSEIIQPGVPRIEEKTMDFTVVFISDVHIGSHNFLEDDFNKFIKWINCEFGSPEQIEIARDVKYLVVAGDIVDGIGVYPNQDEDLSIKDIALQYEEAARLFSQIRSDIKIIIAPGNHDASRLAEPQPAVPEEYAKDLYNLKNVEFVSNPAIVSLDGVKTLIYHASSFVDMDMNVKGLEQKHSGLIMKELLEKRHLAPIYGERTPLASEIEDYLVIDDIPHVFHTGHTHMNSYKKYKGVHMINSGTFQSQTDFQNRHNIIPTPGEVPVLNRGVFKLLKFGE
jgi:DNA polymerase II small subunit